MTLNRRLRLIAARATPTAHCALALCCLAVATSTRLAAAETQTTPSAPADPNSASTVTRQLDPITIQVGRYKPDTFALPTGLGVLSLPQIPGAPFPNLKFGFNVMDTMLVTATRAPQNLDRVSASFRLLNAETLRQSPSAMLDGALRSVPGFSLFRRSDSFTANPTAQGVSLRGLGPSGASRSLVLLDGVPLNDPFGGWVAWTKLPREGIGHSEIVPGGGASAWGNAALGGVVHLFTAPLRTRVEVVDRPPTPIGWTDVGSLRFAATLGDYGTRSVELALVVPTRAGAFQILGRDFATDGFRLVAPERRGPVDVPAWSRHRWLTARWRKMLGKTVEALATARVYEEKRGNGTAYQRNSSREKFASLALAGEPAEHFSWHAIGYAQDQSFASTFSGVNTTRTIETPASDQFAVPSTAFGAAWTGVWQHVDQSRTSFGGDARLVRGETREHFTFVNGAFTRLRVAGGRQAVGGLFALHDHALTETFRASLGARVDGWNDTHGKRVESDRNTGAVSRNDRYPDRDGTTFSPSIGLVWTPMNTVRARAHAQKAFRRPTLNELYRPFRVGPNITEANAALGTERVTSGEVGAEWTLFVDRELPPTGSPQPNARSLAAPLPRTESQRRLVLGATAFANDLRDAVGNVTVARGPGTFPLFGVIAAGGVGRQRLNVDRTRVQGVELSARWFPTGDITVTADYLRNHATVRRATIAPALVGNRIAQVPRDSASVGAVWRGPARFTVVPRLRWIGRQFEDDENQLRLGEVVIADVTVTHKLSQHLELFLTIENLGNARIETGRTSDGIVNIGTPRLALGGLRGTW